MFAFRDLVVAAIGATFVSVISLILLYFNQKNIRNWLKNDLFEILKTASMIDIEPSVSNSKIKTELLKKIEALIKKCN